MRNFPIEKVLVPVFNEHKWPRVWMLFDHQLVRFFAQS